MKHFEKPDIDEHVAGFQANELFFSTTDARGVIQAGNEVFQRVSGYDWSGLIGAPHKVVRHPDMPKAVFYLMWKTLKAGHVFGGYVKNRTACGRYYWVYAVVAPTRDGFLSVRLKPQSDLLGKIEKLYAQIRTSEIADKATPEQSSEVLLSALDDMGHATYRSFMTFALSQEIAQRADLDHEVIDTTLKQFAAVSEKLEILSEDVAKVHGLFDMIQNVPINLNVVGARMGDLGQAIQVVASNYALISSELMRSIKLMASGLDRLMEAAQSGRIGFSSALMLQIAVERFEAESLEEGRQISAYDVQRVRLAFKRFETSTLEACARIAADAANFAKLTEHLRKHLSALAVTRVTCRIEAAAIPADTSSIDEIANKLDEFQTELTNLLDHIASGCETVVASVPKVTSHGLAGLTADRSRSLVK